MIIYADKITPRLRYVADFLARNLFAEEIRITNDTRDLLHPGTAVIAYTEQPPHVEHYLIRPAGLLDETGVRVQQVQCVQVNGHAALFPTAGDHSFDLLSGIFYLLSRYEEYLPGKKDAFGRYAHEQSIAYTNGFLHQPLVDAWLQDFGRSLSVKFPAIKLRSRQFKFLPTYDIDEAFAYRDKQWWRTMGGLGRSLLKGDAATVAERISVLRGRRVDPYDSFAWLDALHERFSQPPIYFFLLAGQTAGYDKNIRASSPAMRSLVRKVSSRYHVGIHPSWQSGDDNEKLRQEITLLNGLTGLEVRDSRQHYLRFSLPATFRTLIAMGIRSEFSMGYGTVNGFRASVATPFYWYDLEKEESTSLLVHPFCFMDANSFYEQRLTAEQAFEELCTYRQEVQRVGGTMITIWHNHFLGSAPSFAGWKEIYRRFFETMA